MRAYYESAWPGFAVCEDDWHMHHHGSRYPHSWASDKNRVEEYWKEREPRQADFRKQLYEREGQVRADSLTTALDADRINQR